MPMHTCSRDPNKRDWMEGGGEVPRDGSVSRENVESVERYVAIL